MQSYIEYLISQGATAEDAKVLDTAAGRKAYEAMNTRLEEAERKAALANEDVEKHRKWVDEEITPLYTKAQNELVIARANEARAATALRTAQERGLIDVAKDLGYEENTVAVTAPAFDASKYVTTDTLLQVAEREGDAIAIAQDIAFEHRQLFPDKPLNFREIRREAVAARKSVEQFWQEKYGVVAAREKRASEDKAAYEKKLREEGAVQARNEMASQYGNPDTRPLAPSRSPFAARPEGERAGKQPWDSTADLSALRVQDATQRFLQKVQ